MIFVGSPQQLNIDRYIEAKMANAVFVIAMSNFWGVCISYLRVLGVESTSFMY